VELGAGRGSGMLPPEVRSRAFELPAPAQGESSSDFVMTPAGDALVFQLVRVTKGEYAAMGESEKDRLQAQSGAEYSGLVDSGFQQGLRDNADITVL
jgi:peptidyl-prolyl cis-trans isomerase D